MRVAFITDQHFGARSNSSIFLDNYDKFYREVFFPTLEERNITRVVGLGDLWEDRRSLSPYTLARTREMFLQPLKDRNIQMDVILGNHDVYYRNSNEVNTVEFLGDLYRNIKVHPKWEVIDLGVPFALISWLHRGNIEEGLQWLETVDAKLLGGHFEIKGFEMTRGQIATHGLEQSVFDRFDKVVSGHFHVRSTIGNIQYLSNPSQTTWADVGLDKGFHIFDSDTLEFEPVNNPFIMFREFNWSDDLSIDDFAGIFARIRVKDFANLDRVKLDKFVSQAAEVAHGVQVLEPEASLDGHCVDGEEIQSTAAIIDEYLQQVAGESKDVDFPFLKRMFGDLYSEAASRMEVE